MSEKDTSTTEYADSWNFPHTPPHIRGKRHLYHSTVQNIDNWDLSPKDLRTQRKGRLRHITLENRLLGSLPYNVRIRRKRHLHHTTKYSWNLPIISLLAGVIFNLRYKTKDSFCLLGMNPLDIY